MKKKWSRVCTAVPVLIFMGLGSVLAEGIRSWREFSDSEGSMVLDAIGLSEDRFAEILAQAGYSLQRRPKPRPEPITVERDGIQTTFSETALTRTKKEARVGRLSPVPDGGEPVWLHTTTTDIGQRSVKIKVEAGPRMSLLVSDSQGGSRSEVWQNHQFLFAKDSEGSIAVAEYDEFGRPKSLRAGNSLSLTISYAAGKPGDQEDGIGMWREKRLVDLRTGETLGVWKPQGNAPLRPGARLYEESRGTRVEWDEERAPNGRVHIPYLNGNTYAFMPLDGAKFERVVNPEFFIAYGSDYVTYEQDTVRLTVHYGGAAFYQASETFNAERY